MHPFLRLTYWALCSLLLTSSLTFAQAPTNGLIAYYPFVGNANDASGGGNNGTVSGATLTTDRNGQGLNAYAFNGSQSIDLGTIVSLTSNASFSISLWVKVASSATLSRAVISTAKSNANFYVSVLHTGKLFFGFGTGSSLAGFSGNKIITDDAWHHVTVTYDLTTVRLYVDGTLDASRPNTTIYKQFGRTFVGSHPTSLTGLNPMTGSLDDIRIYNRALSDAEVKQLYQAEAPIPTPIDLTTGLVAHYPLDGNANDISGNSNHGTPQNGVAFGPDRFGNAGKAANFDGVNDYFTASSSASLSSPSNAITISNWINVDDIAAGAYYLAKVNPGTTDPFQYRCGLNSNMFFGYKNSSNNYVDVQGSSSTIPSATWKMVSYVFNGQDVKFYIDGALVNTITSPGSIFPTNDPLEIGRDSHGPTEWFKGQLDDIRIYNRALSDAEVAALYNLESSGEVATLIVSPSLSVYPMTPTLGATITVNGIGFAANSNVVVRLNRDIPNFLQPDINTTTDGNGKFSVLYNSISEFGTYQAIATDAQSNRATIKFNPIDGANHISITKPFNGSRIPQIATSGPYTFDLVWDDKITLKNSDAGSGGTRSVGYVYNFKLFTESTWSADVVVNKSLPFGKQLNISTSVQIPALGTYSLRIKHIGSSENWKQVDNITIEQLVGTNYEVSLHNNRFTTPIKGLVADGVSRVRLHYNISPSSYAIKRIEVSLSDPIANKNTKELLGVMVDARGISEATAENPNFSPVFHQSFAVQNPIGYNYDFWYLAPIDFSDGTAYLSDAIRKVYGAPQ